MSRENLSKLIGLEIKRYRLENNLTQEELSELSDMNSKYISDIELGKKSISLYKLSRLLNAVNIDLSVFFKKLNL